MTLAFQDLPPLKGNPEPSLQVFVIDLPLLRVAEALVRPLKPLELRFDIHP